jgi:dCTP diphosphatase
MFDWKGLQKKLRAFAKERDWERFHTPKNLSTALMVEAGELAEVFQWDSGSESFSPTDADRERIADEVADVIIYAARLTDVLDIDIEHAVSVKIEKNREKYPVYQERLF